MTTRPRTPATIRTVALAAGATIALGALGGPAALAQSPAATGVPLAAPRVDRRGIAMPLMPENVTQLVRGRMIAAGFTDRRYSAHALPATAATLAHEAGADILSISALLRHQKLDTTRQYIRRLVSGANRAAASWSPGADLTSALRIAVSDDAREPAA